MWGPLDSYVGLYLQFMVYDTYNKGLMDVNGVYKPIYNWGGHHIVDIGQCFRSDGPWD
jgi:hypothetical protein